MSNANQLSTSTSANTGYVTICTICQVPIATGKCLHVVIANGQVIMSQAGWEKMCQDLQALREVQAEFDRMFGEEYDKAVESIKRASE